MYPTLNIAFNTQRALNKYETTELMKLKIEKLALVCIYRTGHDRILKNKQK